MAPRSTRIRDSVPPVTPGRSAGFTRLNCEQLEAREVPALFTVGAAMNSNLMNNNGCVAVADFDKDGYQDAVFTNYGPSETSTAGNSITILKGSASGNFSRTNIPTGGSNVAFVDVADINGDGWTDAVASNSNAQGAGSFSVFRNDGAGNLVLDHQQPSNGNNAACVRLADVTGDGVLDVLVSHFGVGASGSVTGQNISIFQGNATDGKGNFTYNGPITVLAPEIQFIPTAMVVADFNRDNIQDIAACVPSVPEDETTPYSYGNIYIFKGTGAGGFADPIKVETGGVLPVNITAGDVNGDGKLDLVTANAGDPTPPSGTQEFAGGSVGVVLYTGGTGVGSSLGFGAPDELVANTYGPFAVTVADLNLDGKADIAAINHGLYRNLSGPTAFVTMFMNNGAGSFVVDASQGTGQYSLGTTNLGGQYLALGDFNNDGSPDLITATSTGRPNVLRNTIVSPKVEAAVVNGGQADLTQRSRVTGLTVTFSLPVYADAGAFTLKRVGTANNGVGDNALVTATSSGNGTTTLTLSFSGANVDYGSLQDGVWQLTVNRAKIHTTAAGGVYMGFDSTQGGIKRLFGDTDPNGSDGDVDASDRLRFFSAMGQSTGQSGYRVDLDFDGDGDVDATDRLQFFQRLGFTM